MIWITVILGFVVLAVVGPAGGLFVGVVGLLLVWSLARPNRDAARAPSQANAGDLQDQSAAAHGSPTTKSEPVPRTRHKSSKVLRFLDAPGDALSELTSVPGAPRFWWGVAVALTLADWFFNWHIVNSAVASVCAPCAQYARARGWDFVVVAMAIWLVCLLADAHRRLKHTEGSMREMQERHLREMREMRELQEACDRKGQRALAAILEVSVEFADVQRRLAGREASLRKAPGSSDGRPDG